MTAESPDGTHRDAATRPPSSFNLLSALGERRYHAGMNQGEREGGSSGDTPPLQRPPRLKRLDRLFVRHPLYFVTACTEDRKPILANAKVHEDFRKFCEAGLTRGVFVGKYVLMPDHLHLFVAFSDEYESALVERRSNRQSQTDATEETALTQRRYRLNMPSGLQ